MKQFAQLLISSLVLLIFIGTQSCTSDVCEETLRYQKFDPVYITKEKLRTIEIEEAQELKDPGKIYVYGDYLFINERFKGIHIYDNSDIANPIAVAFLSIPGNVDMAVRGGYLYADNFIDLLTFDLSDPQNPLLVNSQENVYTNNRHERLNYGYLVYYKPTDVIEEIDCNSTYYGDDVIFREGDLLVESSGGQKFDTFSNGASAVNGQGGSMARFTLVDDRLYIVDNRNLHIFNVSDPSLPSPVTTKNVGWGIETIFPSGDNLFLGSNSGVFIFDNTNRDNPTFLSKFNHARVCDPVFVHGDVAYVTLRNGNRCGGFTNQLDVLDVSNLKAPKLIKSYPMDNPHGLTILGDRLILCEGQFGLKVLDISDNKDIKTKTKITGKHFYDAIGLSREHIILTGNDGILQYEMSGDDMLELSTINVVK